MRLFCSSPLNYLVVIFYTLSRTNRSLDRSKATINCLFRVLPVIIGNLLAMEDYASG